jgi:hypothetical protein
VASHTTIHNQNIWRMARNLSAWDRSTLFLINTGLARRK